MKDSVLPFWGKRYQGKEDEFYEIASKLRITRPINIGRDAERWRQWIAFKGPLVTRLSPDDTFRFTHGELEKYKPDTAKGGHAVAIVGYTSDSFIVRNSWGTGWGDKGFAFASNEYVSHAFTESFGALVVPA